MSTVDGEKYRLNDKIFANPSNAAASIGDRNLSQSLFQTSHPIVGDDRVAQIIEIKGKDAEHVYLRVLWLYTPDDLPAGGRKSYHGKHELIASNHMSIIDASDMSVLGHVSVSHWEEDETEDPKPGLFWRQTFDVPMEELSVSFELFSSYCRHWVRLDLQKPFHQSFKTFWLTTFSVPQSPLCTGLRPSQQPGQSTNPLC